MVGKMFSKYRLESEFLSTVNFIRKLKLSRRTGATTFGGAYSYEFVPVESYKGPGHEERFSRSPPAQNPPAGSTVAPHNCCRNGVQGIIPILAQQNLPGSISISPALAHVPTIQTPRRHDPRLGTVLTSSSSNPMVDATATQATPAIQQSVQQQQGAYVSVSRLPIAPPIIAPRMPSPPSELLSMPAYIPEDPPDYHPQRGPVRSRLSWRVPRNQQVKPVNKPVNPPPEPPGTRIDTRWAPSNYPWTCYILPGAVVSKRENSIWGMELNGDD